MKALQTAKPIGRPRAFDPEKALDAAMKVFWQKGYEGTSLSDLTRAMGVNRPSIYAAFGDKQTLFCKVLDRYAEGPAGYMREALNQPTARAVVEHLLEGAADITTDPQNPHGCLLVQSGVACGAGAEVIQAELLLKRKAGEKALRERLKRAKAEGDLPQDANPADLARYIMTMLRGIGAQAAGGASRNELRRVIQTALRAWPR